MPSSPSLPRLLALPSSLLLLITSSIHSHTASASVEQTWPRQMSPLEFSRWQEEAVVRQSIEVQRKLLHATAPVGMRKMNPDEGEKFYWDYWDFGETDAAGSAIADSPSALPLDRRRASVWKESDGATNLTSQILYPPYLLHDDRSEGLDSWLSWSPRALFAKRAFQCPSNTRSCTSIQRPNSCCAPDETCVIVEDTGLGDVGCCPAGQGNCGGQVLECDTSAGYSSCANAANAQNGGCCIPGYKCLGVGCVSAGSSVVTTTLPTRTITTGFVSSTSRSSSRTTSSSTRTSTTTRGTPIPPARPTSSPQLTTLTRTLYGSGISICPTAFYPCSARYGGGCCRVGRDCASTSCPTLKSETVVISNGVTVVAGSGTVPGPSTVTGTSPTATRTFTTKLPHCASNWSSCAASVGGGCCPSGYACGASCTASASGVQGTVAKEAPSTASAIDTTWKTMLMVMGIIMLFLTS